MYLLEWVEGDVSKREVLRCPWWKVTKHPAFRIADVSQRVCIGVDPSGDVVFAWVVT